MTREQKIDVKQIELVTNKEPEALDSPRGAQKLWEELGANYDPFRDIRTESDPHFFRHCLIPRSIHKTLKEAYGNELNKFQPGVVLISGAEGSGKTAASVFLEYCLGAVYNGFRVRYLSGDNNGHLNLARTGEVLAGLPEALIVDMPSDAPPDDLRTLLKAIKSELAKGKRSLAVFGPTHLINEARGLFDIGSSDDTSSVITGRLSWTSHELERIVNTRIGSAFDDRDTSVLNIGPYAAREDIRLSEIFENMDLSTPRDAIGFMRMVINSSMEVAGGEVERLSVEQGVDRVQFIYRLFEEYER
jgi:hypothetical protein